MKTFGRVAALLAATSMFSASAIAQQNLESTSGSDASANSGSISGAQSNGNQQGQSQANIGGNNAGIGTSRSNSDSNSTSGSASFSGAASDQAQGQSQGQSANNDQSQGQSANNAQSQGQSANLTNTVGQSVGQTASNLQGVSTNITFNSTNRKHSYVGTNTPVMLAASSSFSSDYCGGTVSGGASVAPIGLSIGGAGTKFDDSCRYLRLAEKAGMLGANYHNMGQPDMALKAMSMMSWAVCMAGPQQDKKHKHYRENHAMEACLKLGLLGSEASPASPPPAYVPPPPPAMESQQENVTPDYSDVPPKTPRGEYQSSVTPKISAAIPH